RREPLSPRQLSLRRDGPQRSRPRGCALRHGGVHAVEVHRRAPGTPERRLTRPAGTVAAAGPAVATAAVPKAAEVALAVLADGGNAYDAAVAACLVECVWLPMKCGL